MTRRRGLLLLLGLLPALFLALYCFPAPLLRAAGSVLVSEGPPAAADMIVVMAGDNTGNRILKAAELARQGFAPVVLVNNSGFTYGYPESDLAVNFAVQHGFAPRLFAPVHWIAKSTVQEAGETLREARARGARRLLIVTTVWHTARTRRVFRRLAPGLQVFLVGADDPWWHNGDWWTDREGRKTFLMESVKTIADYLRI